MTTSDSHDSHDVAMSVTGDAAELSPAAQATAEIRRLNDRLRVSGAGGRIMVTAGIDALPPEMFATILAAIVSFDAFNADNDPHGEHDCAALTVAGYEVIWKVDLYEEAEVKDANAEPVVKRVLTIMLADEY